MASLTELEQWEELLYQLETTDPVVGGIDGISNRQAKQLGNRTRYLLRKLLEGNLSYAVDTGAANAYVATYLPAITSLKDGMVLRFKAVNANTGASTLAVNGLTGYPILGGANAALQGGEIVAGGYCTVQWSASLLSFILQENAGGARQIVDATKQKHALTLGMINGSISSGYIKIPIWNDDGTKKAFIVQWGLAATNTSADAAIIFPITFPTALLSLVASDHTTGGTSIGTTPIFAIGSKTLTGFGVSAYNVSTGNRVIDAAQWIAIGY